MARQGERDQDKERFWRRLLRQWRQNGGTVRDFCARHGLSEPSFYAWRRTIAERDRQAAPRPRPDGHRRLARSKPGEPGGRNRNTPVFLRVRVAPTPAVLEVVLGEGRVVRVPAGFDAATLRQLLALLTAEAPPC